MLKRTGTVCSLAATLVAISATAAKPPFEVMEASIADIQTALLKRQVTTEDVV